LDRGGDENGQRFIVELLTPRGSERKFGLRVAKRMKRLCTWAQSSGPWAVRQFIKKVSRWTTGCLGQNSGLVEDKRLGDMGRRLLRGAWRMPDAQAYCSAIT